MKLANIRPGAFGRIEVTCPHCEATIMRTRAYIRAIRSGVFRCNHCYRLYRVPPVGDKTGKK